MKIENTLARLSDDELLRRLSALLQNSRRIEAELIAHIAEVDGRRLYAREAASSMHVYCTEVLHLSDAEAYSRITVARASRRHPMLLEVLTDGRIHLTGLVRLAPHQAVTEKLERLEAKRFGRSKAPRKTLATTDTSASSRYIPAPVRRTVYERDGGRRTFVGIRGRRCKAHERLEFHHHDRPFGRGGDHRPGGIRLACRAHNALLAEREYGREWMKQFRRRETERCCGAA